MVDGGNGRVPEGWKVSNLGDLVTIQTGKLNSNAATSDGKYPFFTCAREIFKTNTFSFDTECVLLAGNNATGKFPIWYFNGKFDVYQRTYVIRSKELESITNQYFFSFP
jgi:type I restriction enzyme S subunit